MRRHGDDMVVMLVVLECVGEVLKDPAAVARLSNADTIALLTAETGLLCDKKATVVEAAFAVDWILDIELQIAGIP